MAAALVSRLQVVGRIYDGQIGVVATCYFSGADVAADAEGAAQDVLVLLSAGYTLADLRGGVVAAVQARATELGLTVNASDLDMPTYQHGAGPP